MASQNGYSSHQVDRMAIQRIAEVIVAQLNAKRSELIANGEPEASSLPSRTNRNATYIQDRVITAASIHETSSGISIALVDQDAVITPSAKDEAKSRGIEITRVERSPQLNRPQNGSGSRVMDRENPERAKAVENQLRIRGLRDPLPRLILSETPAKELQHQILNVGETATMVGSINEVLRFGQELDVTAWILDMKRLNLTSAVNVAAKIAQKGSGKS
ncbi:MAG: hypothetical protein VXZ38_13090 [Planctomycetota bacterium]|nr:hypothetical protein [Planctomycetota bacterium]